MGRCMILQRRFFSSPSNLKICVIRKAGKDFLKFVTLRKNVWAVSVQEFSVCVVMRYPCKVLTPNQRIVHALTSKALRYMAHHARLFLLLAQFVLGRHAAPAGQVFFDSAVWGCDIPHVC